MGWTYGVDQRIPGLFLQLLMVIRTHTKPERLALSDQAAIGPRSHRKYGFSHRYRVLSDTRPSSGDRPDQQCAEHYRACSERLRCLLIESCS